jgi:subfamily B ATP-binding cassette protein MsbA
LSTLRFFAGYARKYKGWLLVAALAVPLYSVASAAMVTLIEPIFDEVLLAGNAAPASDAAVERGAAAESPKSARESAVPSWLNLKSKAHDGYESLKRRLGIAPQAVVWFVPGLFIVVYVVRSVMDFLSGYAFQRIGLGVINDMRNDLYARLIAQSSAFHSRHPSGELVSRVIGDVGMIQMAISTRLFDLVQQSVTLLFLTVLLMSTHLQLALTCLILTPVVVYALARFGGSMRRASHRGQERMADVTALLSEGVRGHRVVKAFGMEAFERGRFRDATWRHLKVTLRGQMVANISSPVIETLAALGSAVLLAYAGTKVRAGELTAPVLVQFIANLMLMYDPIRKLNRVNLVLQQAVAGTHRVREMLEAPNEVADRPGAVTIDGVRESLRFEDVHFGYGDEPVLRGIDLEIKPGEIVALVGPSGAGKTSLVNLLPRFFDPIGGRVVLDGRDIRDVTLASLRAQIGIVTQETLLFNDTIRNNIAYGRSDLPLERVREAARAAYADDFILQQPKGYDTVIGESGSQLSGGQRQRLSIARALLKNAPILILDEATSHLDSESESLVQRALVNLMRDRTTLVVAHRLATVMRANRIVVLEAGRIVEIGSHAELLERGGLYRRLYQLQLQEAG